MLSWGAGQVGQGVSPDLEPTVTLPIVSAVNGPVSLNYHAVWPFTVHRFHSLPQTLPPSDFAFVAPHARNVPSRSATFSV